MLGVELKGHDYKYEVAELLKLFTTQFRFIKDNEEYDKRIINSVNIDSNEVNSLTNYYEGENLVISKQESFDITKLNNEEVKKKTKTVIKRSMFKVLDKVFETYVPWGVLTGIRPVKIVHSLLDKGISESEIREILKNNYLIKDEKIDLALDIAKRERVFIYPIDKNKISLYVSIPFCPTRCVYCSFPANPMKQFGHLRDDYIKALIKEIKGLAKLLKDTNKEIETLYIGGGTPTALEADQLDTLINALFKELDLTNIKEFTVEAGRPDTITKEKLEVMKKHNVTRISINPQTMNDETLVKIGRDHNVNDIVDCFKLARGLGFDNINMDIILGLVDENLDMVRNTLEKIKELNPESLTVHTLAIKRASTLKENLDKYELTRYEEMIKMIELSMEYAKDMGLNPYYMYRQKHMLGNLENIGYAKEGFECIYNIQIMEEKQSNLAVGAGAISKYVYVDEDRIERTDNVKNVELYIERIEEMIERKVKEVYKNVN
ncbi:coproporphyrinogen III oxidase,Oxygen-independent coproporphyrinogen-III oxidase 2,coproporphyrinogen III oxidase,Putative heme iron utilization protein,coproporphyrinogen dehydrogenase HemZ,Radical SAM superfamily [[Clostridium] sordellii]|uniref:coproporphyrinogen dehydrogenase HemZ n=1 Tax=Paraclostridium sordellii TaxID=1505 RepID=UPI00054333F1|nr:coproporphyrinogen dehydrogenase HemZ [Paeniclostridium sordellii]CEK35987.1 coproporphyrinogen III oxidase,Oxygen-independent coproporphyrinogen-III oxidase 2,coproporphyrinogen III oxidase,Putative heme iron utilization protein,coproporphyrinogen dehydrogenase HemZ,Radical SAM superfamily [[Clostridium] sordellii] [Paeniclostridium sordellii]